MDVPSGAEIAEWFRREHAPRLNSFQEYDGLDLVRDGSDYCYVWLKAYVDLDFVGYFLLDVRTSVGSQETRDFLLVWDGFEQGFEWRNRPIESGAGSEVHRARLKDGMAWMADRIDRKEAD